MSLFALQKRLVTFGLRLKGSERARRHDSPEKSALGRRKGNSQAWGRPGPCEFGEQ